MNIKKLLKFNFLRNKKEKGKDLTPKGIERSIVPKGYIDRFPINDLSIVSGSKVIHLT